MRGEIWLEFGKAGHYYQPGQTFGGQYFFFVYLVTRKILNIVKPFIGKEIRNKKKRLQMKQVVHNFYILFVLNIFFCF